MPRPDNQMLVIFGASGDLTKRKLLPSLFELFIRVLPVRIFPMNRSGRNKRKTCYRSGRGKKPISNNSIVF